MLIQLVELQCLELGLFNLMTDISHHVQYHFNISAVGIALSDGTRLPKHVALMF